MANDRDQPGGAKRYMCDSKELLVSFLYDEIDPVSRRAFRHHLTTCAECRDELAMPTWTETMTGHEADMP